MINGELIVDNFAGGGGASTGIELATGISVDIAINHDPEAIKMHKTNHPSTKHYCESVWDVDPIEACNGRPVGLAWFSPDCKHFSKAKGGKPKDKKIRGLAWVALRWAALVRPRVIMLENVEEFKTWGPLNRSHRPIKNKQGSTFRKFVSQLEKLGYVVEYKELVAADYGAPTTRRRFFLIARCDGSPIAWPVPTHGARDSEQVKTGMLEPWLGAYTQIDFSLPCPSIFDTAEEIKEKYGMRAVRPLAPKTLERIAKGLKKYVIENEEPFVLQVNHSKSSSDYCKSAYEPLQVITSKHGFGIAEPYLVPADKIDSTADQYVSFSSLVNMGEKTSENVKIAPIIDKAYGGNYQGFGSKVEDPIDTITTVDHNRLVEATLVPFLGVNTTNHPGGDIKEPLHTITTGNQQCLISPTLIQYHSETSDKTARGQAVEEPLLTIDVSSRYGLVQSFLSKSYESETHSDSRLYLQEPDEDVVEQQLATSYLIQMNKNCYGRDISEPIPTITAGDGHYGEVRAFLKKYNVINGNENRFTGKATSVPVEETKSGCKMSSDENTLSGDFQTCTLIKYYGQGTGQSIVEPLDTITPKDRFGLITIKGVDYQIVDIGLRMLEPKELYGCQGFLEDYIIDRDYSGKVYKRSEQVKRCGNAVCPPIPAALVKANLPELCKFTRMPNMGITSEQNGQLRFA